MIYWKFLNKRKNQGVKKCNLSGLNCKEFESIGVSQKSGKESETAFDKLENKTPYLENEKRRNQLRHNTSHVSSSERKTTDLSKEETRIKKRSDTGSGELGASSSGFHKQTKRCRTEEKNPNLA